MRVPAAAPRGQTAGTLCSLGQMAPGSSADPFRPALGLVRMASGQGWGMPHSSIGLSGRQRRNVGWRKRPSAVTSR